jgi:hypothetical protein
LLLLRAAAGGTAALMGTMVLSSATGPEPHTFACAWCLLIAGGLVLIGVLTPLTAGVLGLSIASCHAGTVIDGGLVASGLLIVDCAAVVLIGPGAFSVDARLFGRREILISTSPRSRNS